MELWKPYRDMPYSVSNEGNVRRDGVTRLLRPSMNEQGIWYVKLVWEDRVMVRSVALMVAEVWCDNDEPSYNSVIHLDGDRRNSRAENLMKRPRSMAIEYHRQFRTRGRDLLPVNSFIELTTGRVKAFNKLSEAGRTFGVLDRVIDMNLIINQARRLAGQELALTPPTGHIFLYL